MSDWKNFITLGDQWFVSYATSPSAPGVCLFQIGHAVELYLKGSYTKLTSDINKAITYGHRIKELWDELKAIDSNFLPNFEIRDAIFDSDFMHYHAEGFSEEDKKHYFINAEFYFISKHLPDLKYIGLPLKTITPQYTLGFIHPNPYWITFVRDIRSYLHYPNQGELDWIIKYIDDKLISSQAIYFLNNLYN